MVNSGAIMTAGVLASQHPSMAARDGPTGPSGAYGSELCTSALLPVWRKLTADGIVGDIGFDEETFLSERATADNNRGIAYMMKAQKGLPPAVGVDTMLDFYLRCCSISSNCASMSILAATLANGGRNPVTNEVVFDVDVVKQVLSVMTFCGQYDAAGEFFLHVGMPSKVCVCLRVIAGREIEDEIKKKKIAHDGSRLTFLLLLCLHACLLSRLCGLPLSAERRVRNSNLRAAQCGRVCGIQPAPGLDRQLCARVAICQGAR